MVTMLTGSGTGKIGTTVNLFLDAGVGDASLPYQLASSFGAGPIPIDTRLLGLTYDSLLGDLGQQLAADHFPELLRFPGCQRQGHRGHQYPQHRRSGPDPDLHRVRDHQGRRAVQHPDHFQYLRVHHHPVTHVV